MTVRDTGSVATSFMSFLTNGYREDEGVVIPLRGIFPPSFYKGSHNKSLSERQGSYFEFHSGKVLNSHLIAKEVLKYVDN
jgi:hypothetical protein